MIPIPGFLVKWVGEGFAKLIAYSLVLLLVVGLLTALYVGVKTYFVGDLATRARVIAGQMQAGGESAHDAVQTIGNTTGNETASEEVTRENTDAITKADGAAAVVAPAVRNAGLQSLCSRASYRASHPSCVQPAATR